MPAEQDPTLRGIPKAEDIATQRHAAGLRPSGLPKRAIETHVKLYRKAIKENMGLQRADPQPKLP